MRLRLLPPPLRKLLAALDERALQRVTVAVAQLAAEWNGMESDPPIADVLTALRSGALPTQASLDALAELAARLEEESEALQEQADASPEPPAEYAKAFARARAASAVLEAVTNADALSSAAEACYEALAAVGDEDTLIDAVEQACLPAP